VAATQGHAQEPPMLPRPSWKSRLFLAALTLPLLAGACIDMSTRVAINSFFNASAPYLSDAALAWLGLPATTP
jgi:hypothetical protein